MSDMVEQRGSLGAASIGDRVYAVGGGKPGQQSASMEILDVARNTWLPGKLMHHKRCVLSLSFILIELHIIILLNKLQRRRRNWSCVTTSYKVWDAFGVSRNWVALQFSIENIQTVERIQELAWLIGLVCHPDTLSTSHEPAWLGNKQWNHTTIESPTTSTWGCICKVVLDKSGFLSFCAALHPQCFPCLCKLHFSTICISFISKEVPCRDWCNRWCQPLDSDLQIYSETNG